MAGKPGEVLGPSQEVATKNRVDASLFLLGMAIADLANSIIREIEVKAQTKVKPKKRGTK